MEGARKALSDPSVPHHLKPLTPEAQARVAVFLSSDAAEGIHGEVIAVVSVGVNIASTE